MTNRERFFKVMAGEPVDRPPFFPDTTNWYGAHRTEAGKPRKHGSGGFIGDDDPVHENPGTMPPDLVGLTHIGLHRQFGWGLPVHVYDWFKTVYDGVDVSVTTEGNKRITHLKCHAGELRKTDSLAADGSWAPGEHFIRKLDDLEIMRYVVSHTRYEPRFERVDQVLEAIGEMGVADITLMRSPFGKLVHELMGFEQVIYALVDDRACLIDYMAFQEEQDLVLARLAAQSPARIVILSDHADENLISPPYYEEFCIPHYRKLNDILHAAGKIVSTHLDGNFKGYFPLLGATGFDLLDGCTPAPMMNYEVEQLAEAMTPGMKAYCGVPATLFVQGLGDEVVCDYGRRILDAMPGRVVLNVGDILPTDGDIGQLVALGEMVEGYGRQ